jgi:hypothetical protein
MEGRHAGLDVIARLAEERGSHALAAEAAEARRTLQRGRFNVAVVGQYKRGKSTLINALLGREWLPADVQPVTSAVTIVEHGEVERAVVRFAGGREHAVAPTEIADFVSEEGNPGNVKEVRAAVLELPSPLLALGVRLVDTPGVGSVFAANSEVTRQFVPKVDIAVVVLGSDPPISGEELDLIRAVSGVAGRLLFVINKADRHREETLRRAESFTRRVLADALGHDPGAIRHVSARRALQSGNDAGAASLLAELAELARREGTALAGDSAARTARALAARLLEAVEIEAAALRMPLAELDRRIALFEESMRDIEDLALAVATRVRTGFAFDREHWKQREERSVTEATSRALDDMQTAINRGPLRRGEARRRAVELARAAVARIVADWRAETEAELGRFHRAHAERVGAETDRLATRAAEAAAHAFGTDVARFAPVRLTSNSPPLAVDLSEPSTALDLSVVLGPIVVRVLPLPLVRRWAMSSARTLMSEWLRRGLNDIDQRLVERLDSITRTLDGAAREYLEGLRAEIVAAAEGARQRQSAGEAAVADRLAVLERQRIELSRLLHSPLGPQSVCPPHAD